MKDKNENFRYFIAEDDFELSIARINALGNPYLKWQLTQARKNHTDEFGEIIKAGDDYYKKSSGPSYSDVVKLSRKSMNIFAFLYFLDTPGLRNLADEVIKKRVDEHRKAVDGLKL